MSSRSERMRRELQAAGSVLARHSMNQEIMKRSADGERRLRMDKLTGQSDFQRELEEYKSSEIYQLLFGVASKLDHDNEPIQIRIGKLALKISSIINGVLKDNPREFADSIDGAQRLNLRQGSQFANLVPVELMAANFIRDLRDVVSPESIKSAQDHAKVFAENFGSLIFNQGPEITAISAEVVLSNISIHIASEMNQCTLDEYSARRMIMVFGETTNMHLSRFKVKRKRRTKSRN